MDFAQKRTSLFCSLTPENFCRDGSDEIEWINPQELNRAQDRTAQHQSASSGQCCSAVREPSIRAAPLAIDEEVYKWRHLIENFFGKLKEFKRIALRADKTDQSFAAMIHIAAAVINSR